LRPAVRDCQKPQHRHVRRKRRRLHEAMVVGQQARTELLSQRDIERVGGREIVAVAPGGLDQRRDRRVTKMPTAKPTDGDARLRLGELLTEKLPAQHAEDLGIEVLRHPALGPNREQPRERPAASRIADDLDAGRGVDGQRGSRLGVDAQRAQCVGGIDAFKLRLGTREQLVNERTERLGRGVLVRIGEHDSRARWKVRRYARHGLIVPCSTNRKQRSVAGGVPERALSAILDR
jgi:hypothetical protein